MGDSTRSSRLTAPSPHAAAHVYPQLLSTHGGDVRGDGGEVCRSLRTQSRSARPRGDSRVSAACPRCAEGLVLLVQPGLLLCASSTTWSSSGNWWLRASPSGAASGIFPSFSPDELVDLLQPSVSAIACFSPSSTRPGFVSARSAASPSPTSIRLACSCASVRARDTRTASFRSRHSPSSCSASGGAPSSPEDCSSRARRILSVPSILPPSNARSSVAARARRHHQTRLSSHAPSLVRHAPDGAGHAHARHPGAARPRPRAAPPRSTRTSRRLRLAVLSTRSLRHRTTE